MSWAALIQAVIGLASWSASPSLVGFRPAAGALEMAGRNRHAPVFTFALIWLSVALGLAAKSVETASNTPMLLTLLPFLGSGFVPTESMPAGLRWFAEYQPFTPVTETVRKLLTGGAAGHSAIAAIAWSIGIIIAAYLWSIHLYNNRPIR